MCNTYAFLPEKHLCINAGLYGIKAIVQAILKLKSLHVLMQGPVIKPVNFIGVCVNQFGII